MKAADLIKALQAVDPESEVSFGIGDKRDDNYRDMCAKGELQTCECLQHLRVETVEIVSDKTPWAHVVLRQSNISSYDLECYQRDFDKKYPELVLYKNKE